MRKVILVLIVVSGLTPISSTYGQDITFPEWIEGTWHNSAESNTNNFEYWTFSNDKIYLTKGLPINKSNRVNLNDKYSEYKISIESNDSLCGVNFIKGNEIIFYEFKLQKVSYSDNPALTYSMKINGIVKREHSTSCNLVLTK